MVGRKIYKIKLRQRGCEDRWDKHIYIFVSIVEPCFTQTAINFDRQTDNWYACMAREQTVDFNYHDVLLQKILFHCRETCLEQ